VSPAVSSAADRREEGHARAVLERMRSVMRDAAIDQDQVDLSWIVAEMPDEVIDRRVLRQLD